MPFFISLRCFGSKSKFSWLTKQTFQLKIHLSSAVCFLSVEMSTTSVAVESSPGQAVPVTPLLLRSNTCGLLNPLGNNNNGGDEENVRTPGGNLMSGGSNRLWSFGAGKKTCKLQIVTASCRSFSLKRCKRLSKG